MKNDNTLEYLRGFAVFQVVFVHIIYWLEVITSDSLTEIKSFTLFEMVLFFFVTGAVNNYSREDSYRAFCIKRLKKFLIPYYVYASICVPVALIYYLTTKQLTVRAAFLIFLTWIVPLNTQIMPFDYVTWELWYIPVYVIAIVLFPILKKAVRKFGLYAVAMLSVLFSAAAFLTPNLLKNIHLEGTGVYVHSITYIIQETIFYMIFMGLGIMYPKLKERNRSFLISAVILLAVSVSALVIIGIKDLLCLDMQSNKFPPNHAFMLFSFAFLSAFYLMFPLIKKLSSIVIEHIPAIGKFFSFLSVNSLYIFLYQSVPFLAVNTILIKSGIKGSIIGAFLAFALIYPFVCGFVFVILKIKSFFIRYVIKGRHVS